MSGRSGATDDSTLAEAMQSAHDRLVGALAGGGGTRAERAAAASKAASLEVVAAFLAVRLRYAAPGGADSSGGGTRDATPDPEGGDDVREF